MTDAMVRWHKSDLLDRMYCNIEDGKKIAMPRYYKDKIYDEVERHQIAVKARNENFERQQEEERKAYEKYGDYWTQVKAESDMNLFRKMYKNATDGRD